MLRGMKLRSKPGTKVEYSNLGYDILGAIIEVAGHRRYEDKQYMPFFFSSVAQKAPFYMGAVPDGYLMSTAEDMSFWLQAQMGTRKIPEQIARCIEKSHMVDTNLVYQSSPKKGNGYYTYG